MELATFQSLLSPAGQSAIAAASDLEPVEESFLPCLTALQKRFPRDLAKAALETAILRRRAEAKFSRSGSMYFTRAGLEMASGETVSRYRAERFAPFARVADLCCGIGGDTIGLAHRPAEGGTSAEAAMGAERVVAVDIDPVHVAMAAANVAAYGRRAEFVVSDLRQAAPPDAEAMFFDPGRRARADGGRRLSSVHSYQPPLSLLDPWRKAPLGVKVSPAVDLAELAAYDCELEFISVNGELKESVLWLGPLQTEPRRATLLPSRHTLTAIPGAGPPPLDPPLAYLYEPDPAVLRAGLVKDLAVLLGASQMDPDIAYLTSGSLTPSPYARAFAIEAAMPFSQKRLRQKLRAMNVGRVTVKKRGSPLDVDKFARALKLRGDGDRFVFLTHVRGQAWALIGSQA